MPYLQFFLLIDPTKIYLGLWLKQNHRLL